MNFIFPDRVALTRDPLGFLLSRTNHALAPLTPLALGFHRVHLISDLALINDRSFDSGTLCVSDFSSAVFTPITIDDCWDGHQIAQNTTETRSIDCTRVINDMTHNILINSRKSIFSAYQHASFDCWRFSSILATKLTFAALFGSKSMDAFDQRAFTIHAERIYSSRDLIALDFICERERERLKREQLCKQSLQKVGSMIRTAFKHRQPQSVCDYIYKTESETFRSFKEIYQLVLAVHQATAEAFFWVIFALARAKFMRAVIENEADACLLSNGDLGLNKLYLAKSTKNISLEIIRLAPIHNIIVYIVKSCARLVPHGIRSGDKIVICPHVIFRSGRYFPNADSLIVGRAYDVNLLKLQYLASGGGAVFHIVLLNLVLFLLDLAAAFELEVVEGPREFTALPSLQAARPDVKVRLNLRRSRLFR